MHDEKISKLACGVIQTEAKMISQLAKRIDQHFIQACHSLVDCKGRIIVIGVGKSGHICKKMAATFASTGSPAFFIHPSEAKHGDMGMMTANDVVIALSNSGESEEIITLLPFIKRLNIPLICLTGRPNSTLAQAATMHIDVSVTKEACPLGLAPTSSTTAALVMGDALAMVLLEMRGFTAKDFALSHPGGTLGRRLLLQVDSLMHKNEYVPIVVQHALLRDALVEMTQKKLGMTTVVNHAGKLVGIFTDGDLRRVLDKNMDIQTTRVQQVISTDPKTITRETLVTDALRLMEMHKITSLVVTNEEYQPNGVIHIHDILRAGVT
jgi:arabinose-5-phosphate isomerase